MANMADYGQESFGRRLLRILGWSFPIGRLFGVRLRVYGIIVLVPLFAWREFSGFGLTSFQALQLAFVFTLGLYLVVWTHEMGHVTAGRRYHIPTSQITLSPLGGSSYGITVRNGEDAPDNVVWSKTGITADRYGDGAASIARRREQPTASARHSPPLANRTCRIPGSHSQEGIDSPPAWSDRTPANFAVHYASSTSVPITNRSSSNRGPPRHPAG